MARPRRHGKPYASEPLSPNNASRMNALWDDVDATGATWHCLQEDARPLGRKRDESRRKGDSRIDVIETRDGAFFSFEVASFTWTHAPNAAIQGSLPGGLCPCQLGVHFDRCELWCPEKQSPIPFTPEHPVPEVP